MNILVINQAPEVDLVSISKPILHPPHVSLQPVYSSDLSNFFAQVSYGKGPDYFRLKTEVFPVSVFLLLISMKFGTELENYQYDSFK